jgi:preprotein translocase subunit SecB
MNDNKTYKLDSLTLVESSFKREANIDFSNTEIKNSVDIDIQHTVNNDKIFIDLEVTLIGKLKRTKLFQFKTKYVGQFEKGDENILPIEKFVEANGPAIMYPFVREHIATTSIKAGMNPILLPPVNFVKLNSDRLKKVVKEA